MRPAKAITRRRLALNVTMDQVHVIAGHIHVIVGRIHVIAGRIHVIAGRIHVIADHIHVIADHIERDRGSHSPDRRSRSTPSPVACTRSGDVFLRRPITLHVIADRVLATTRWANKMSPLRGEPERR